MSVKEQFNSMFKAILTRVQSLTPPGIRKISFKKVVPASELINEGINVKRGQSALTLASKG